MPSGGLLLNSGFFVCSFARLVTDSASKTAMAKRLASAATACLAATLLYVLAAVVLLSSLPLVARIADGQTPKESDLLLSRNFSYDLTEQYVIWIITFRFIITSYYLNLFF